MKALSILVLTGTAIVAVGSVSAARTALPAGNLVKNPGAEAVAGAYQPGVGKPAGWETEGRGSDGEPRDFLGIASIGYGTSESYLQKPQSAPVAGAARHFYGQHNVAWARQAIDVSGAAAEIDTGGVKACLSAYLGGVQDQPSGMRVDVTFLDESESTLGAIRIGPVTAGQRRNQTGMLRRFAERNVPPNTRQLRVVLTAENPVGAEKSKAVGGGPTLAYADNISVALTNGNCEPVLVVKCVKKALVATVTSSTVAKTRRVQFAVKGRRTKQAADGRAPYMGRFTMDRLTGRLTVTATVTQVGSGPIVLTKKSKRC
jgi:hypothetical protein